MSLHLRFTAASDRGLVRENNEDSAYAGPHLLVLADGMGGHAAGEVASQLMVRHLQHLDKDPEDNDTLALLGAAADDANAAIAKHVQEHAETQGMGTTLSAMVFNGHEFGVCHVGDSRGYLLRDGKLSQITKDDTYVQSLVDEGKLDPADVSSHPHKSLILKAYTGRDVEPTLFHLAARPGDRILLCSDGLSDPVTASTIELALGQGSIDDAAGKLVELALRSGGPDNVTVVVAEVGEGASQRQSPVTAGALAGKVPEPTHPDSAAGRAAALNRRSQAIPGHGGAELADADEEVEHRRRRGIGWPVIAALLLVIALVAGAGIWAKNYLDNTYYLAVAEDEQLTIQQGADFDVFGRSLHHTDQVACLTKENSLRLSAADCGGKDTPFRLSDLPEAERAAVGNFEPGSRTEMQTHMQNLSAKALKPCIKAPSDKKSSQKPGVNCREVK